MRANLRLVRVPLNRHKPVSAFDRLGLKWGCKPETAKDRIYGDRGIYQMVADANEAFLAVGHSERVMMLMAPIDASLFTELPPLEECIYQHDVRDANEDVAQAEFVKHAGDNELTAWIIKLTDDTRAAEKLCAALVRERDRRKALK